MPKGRIQSARRKARRATQKSLTPPKAHESRLNRFLGLSLSGGKSDKACIAIVEYYPEHKKVFLARLFDRIKSDVPLASADLKIFEVLEQYEGQAESLAMDVPLTLPKCISCQLKCPGYEVCTEPEIKWFRSFFEKINLKKRPKRSFTPYTQRCVETYLGAELEEKLEIHHALGSNLAPLTARALYLGRRLKIKKIEVIPKLSIWRMGQKLRVNKSQLRSSKHSVSGEEARRVFLSALTERESIFIYHQDFKMMVENNHAFEAFICAYTGFLSHRGCTESRPAHFPKNEAWVEFPKLEYEIF